MTRTTMTRTTMTHAGGPGQGQGLVHGAAPTGVVMSSTASRPGWWARNWKWAVPLGAATLFLGFVGLAVLIVSLVFGLLRDSPVYQGAVGAARSSPVVVRELGLPIEEGLFVSGQINVSGQSGNADLAIPITGPDGAAMVYAMAQRRRGVWTFDSLEVAFQDGSTLDLLE